MTSEVLTGPSPGTGAGGAGGHHRVIVIGAGFTGLTVGLALLRRGVDDVVLLERAHDVGGVWRDNTYPGVGVDTPSPLYQLRRMANPDWSDLYAPGHEVLDYSRRLARTDGLMERVRFGHDVHDARWDTAARCWRISTDQSNCSPIRSTRLRSSILCRRVMFTNVKR